MATIDCELLTHQTDEPSSFRPEELQKAVRVSRNLPEVPVPAICVLDFDGDLTDWLVSQTKAVRFEPWACFHTSMFGLEVDGARCGIIPRTIGGPYAVLVAEQLRAAGAHLILGLTSAGRVLPSLPLPSLIAVTSAVRDEGTSFHYLPPARTVSCPTAINGLFEEELSRLGLNVFQGAAWTTDAPYRETRRQFQRYAAEHVLVVEMQAASLFAFGAAHNANVGVIAHVTNALEHSEGKFDKGSEESNFALLQAMIRAGHRFLNTPKSSWQ
jgi:uridine phosphorylase